MAVSALKRKWREEAFDKVPHPKQQKKLMVQGTTGKTPRKVRIPNMLTKL